MSSAELSSDAQVVAAFTAGEGEGYGPTLHVEGEVLMLSGWWHTAVRLAPDVFILRDEAPREDSPALELVADALRARGLHRVAGSHPLIQPITYARLSLVGVEWTVWAPDLEVAERALAAWVGMEAGPRDLAAEDLGVLHAFGSEMEGARRTAGLPPSVALTVGLSPDRASGLEAALPEYRFERRRLEEMEPEACGAIRPRVVIVDATSERGRQFVMELRASACGRFLPVVALTPDADVPLGADLALTPDSPAGEWRARLLEFL